MLAGSELIKHAHRKTSQKECIDKQFSRDEHFNKYWISVFARGYLQD